MIVYGDGQLGLTVSDIAAELHKRLSTCSEPTLHELRVRCVIAGQLEQAAFDSDADWAAEAEAVATLCSGVFAARVLGSSKVNSWSLEDQAQASRMLDGITSRANHCRCSYPIKIPEGFAWYAVYPDSYVRAALDWARTARKRSCVTVVGLRSIGTTLSSVITAALRLRGFAVNRITVRPGGAPYDRRVDIPKDLPVTDAAIVVDEGPGRSGSSMAATATALSRKGFPDRDIAFFPAHANGPGCEASELIQRRWRNTDIRVGELMRPGEHSLCDRIEMGGGLWMSHASVCPQDANAVAPALEAPKYLIKDKEQQTLWKFTGFVLSPNRNAAELGTSSDDIWHRLARLAEAELVPRPVSCEDGWTGTPWVDGYRSTPETVNASDLSQACKYIRAAIDPPLEKALEINARHRLANLLTENVRELCETEIDVAQRAAEVLERETRLQSFPTYGDGRLAPHEWVRTPAGQLLKLDAGGHSFDHTAVGPQAILWDVAGLIVEWNLPLNLMDELLETFELPVDLRRTLACYVAAYAAFRGGVATLCGASNKQRAIAYYTGRLKNALAAIRVDSR